MTVDDLRRELRAALASIPVVDSGAALDASPDHRARLQAVLEGMLQRDAGGASTGNEAARYRELDAIHEAWKRELSPVLGALSKATSALERARTRAIECYLERSDAAEPGRKLRRFADRVEDPHFANAIRAHLFERRASLIEAAIRERRVAWRRAITEDERFGSGFDERVVELPLAADLARLDEPGVVLDAGSSLNHPFIQSAVGVVKARVIHYTQSSDREPALFDGAAVSYLFGDLRDIRLRSQTCDRIVCVSTLEHVGMDNSRYGGAAESDPEAYLEALREMWRLVAPGGLLFLTFPFGVAAVHGWFRVFDHAALERMRTVLDGARIETRVLSYRCGWHDAPRDDLDPSPVDDSIDARPQLSTERIAAVVARRTSAETRR